LFLEYFPLITKFTCSTLDTNQKCFCMLKTLAPWKWTILVFFQTSFSLPNVHHSFFKLERILKLTIKNARGLELINCFYNPFEHIWLKSAFGLENYGVWKCGFNKSCSYICDKGHECIIYISICSKNVFIYKMQS
jgi:hypothetical protein